MRARDAAALLERFLSSCSFSPSSDDSVLLCRVRPTDERKKDGDDDEVGTLERAFAEKLLERHERRARDAFFSFGAKPEQEEGGEERKRKEEQRRAFANGVTTDAKTLSRFESEEDKKEEERENKNRTNDDDDDDDDDDQRDSKIFFTVERLDPIRERHNGKGTVVKITRKENKEFV